MPQSPATNTARRIVRQIKDQIYGLAVPLTCSRHGVRRNRTRAPVFVRLHTRIVSEEKKTRSYGLHAERFNFSLCQFATLSEGHLNCAPLPGLEHHTTWPACAKAWRQEQPTGGAPRAVGTAR